AEGILQRMFAASTSVPAMYDMIRAIRGAGFRTGLLSNSWGCDEYPRADFPGLFDAVVISGECGMRKPEQAIFLHAAKCIGLAPEQCVFIDDMETNVAAAAACGMTGVHHTEAAQTVAAVKDLLGVPLNGAHSAPGQDYRPDLDGGRRVRPDIAFTARKVAVFVDGCFWHACPEHGSKPRANEWNWGPKLIKNVERDRVNDAALILAGWTVVRLWEHVPLEEAVAAVVAALA